MSLRDRSKSVGDSSPPRKLSFMQKLVGITLEEKLTHERIAEAVKEGKSRREEVRRSQPWSPVAGGRHISDRRKSHCGKREWYARGWARSTKGGCSIGS